MEEINPIKTYNFFYTPKTTSHNFGKIRASLLEKNSKQKMLSQKGQIFPLNISIKTGNNNYSNFINDNKIESSNTNPNQNPNINYISHNNFPKKRKTLLLPNMFYKNNNSNYYRNKTFYNKNKIKKGKTPNKINIKTNNYLSVINHNNYNDIYKSKENKESVEWMLYNKRKNGFKDSNNNIDILDEIYNLKKYDAYIQMNQLLVPPLFDYNNIYNSYNEFKKKHDKDYLLFGNNNHKRKSKEFKDKKEKNDEISKYNDFDSNNNRVCKKRKLGKYNILSIPGSHKGMEKINQDVSLLVENINECKNIKLFGVFDGHGNYGDILSKEISEFFSTFFSNKNLYEDIKLDNDDNDNNDNSCNINKRNKIKIKIEKYNFKTEVKQNEENETDKNNSKQKKWKLNIKTKFKKFNELSHNRKSSLLLSKFKNIKSIINNKVPKNKKIKNAYDILSSNNYFQIYNSFDTIDKILHDKYTTNKICHGSGVALSFLILFNDHYLDNDKNKSYNKIISANLGNTKIILISDDKKIKELNICHTPYVKEERLRVENNGGKIDKIDWLKVGPLRVWFKDKKYPGLSITRSLGDFEAEPLGILSRPDIKEFDIDEEKIKIVVMGTNGIWEFLTNDKIMDIVLGYYEYEDANGASQKIVEIAGKLWKIKNPNNIPDLTVVVLFFK